MIITIDGPSGTGKSTVATQVSKELGFLHMDTGALYRSLTYALMRASIPLQDQKAVEEFVEHNQVKVSFNQGVPHYSVGSLDTTHEIRSSEVTKNVSLVSSYFGVRKSLIEVQRSLAKGINVVSEGRDMGTNVFPHAEVKVFLTAKPEIRARRRYLEMKEKGLLKKGSTVDTILNEMQLRDHTDSTREVNPLSIPKEATIIDTSDMSIEEVVRTIISLAI